MSTELVDAALRVTTPLAFLSLLAMLAYFAHAQRLKHRERVLEKLPEARRATVIDEYLTRYRIDGKDFSEKARLSLIREELDKRYRRSRERAFLTAVVFVACFAMAVFAFIRRGNPRDERGGRSVEVKGALRHVELERTKVRARVANQGRDRFDVNAGKLEADCAGSKVSIDLRLPKGAVGLVDRQREQLVELEAHYEAYPILPPDPQSCRYTVTLDAANGAEVRKLTTELVPRAKIPHKQRLTLFEFEGAPESRDVYVQYKDALRAAEPIAAGDVALVELARAEIEQVPLTFDALDGIQKRSLSLALASGSVTRQTQGFQVRSSLFVGGVPRAVRERLLNVRVLLSQDNGFYIARQLSEMAIYYALAWSTEQAKRPGALDYLAKARSTAASVLSKPDLPPELRTAAEEWERFLTKCLNDRTPAC